MGGISSIFNLPKGSVIQTVSQVYTTSTTISSSSDTDIGLSATITPSSATNKILVTASVILVAYGAPSQNVAAGWQVKTSSGTIVIGGTYFSHVIYQTSTTFNIAATQSKQILHSPATTSAITYKLTGRVNGASSVTFNYTESGDYPQCVLTLQEIVA
jgi:hypothetical protein